MKYTRFEFKNINMINRSRAVIKYYIWIPLAVVLIGYIISQVFIVPLALKSNKETVHVDTPSLPEYQEMINKKYYIIQMGAFASLDNSNSFASVLKNAGIPSYVSNEGQYYFVIVCGSNDLKYIKDKAANYQAAGYSCIIKELAISPGNISDELKKDQDIITLSNFFNTVGLIIDKYCEIYKSYEQKAIDYDTMIRDIAGEQVKLNEFSGLHQSNSRDDLMSRITKTSELIKDVSNVNNNSSSYIDCAEKMLKIIYNYEELSKYTGMIGQ